MAKKFENAKTMELVNALTFIATGYEDEMRIVVDDEDALDNLVAEVKGFLESRGYAIAYDGEAAAPTPTQTKTTSKSTSKKSTSKKSKTSSDDFDYATYIAKAKEIGAVGKRGKVYKACREFVYAYMGREGYTKLTKAQASRKVKAYTDTFK